MCYDPNLPPDIDSCNDPGNDDDESIVTYLIEVDGEEHQEYQDNELESAQLDYEMTLQDYDDSHIIELYEVTTWHDNSGDVVEEEKKLLNSSN